MSHVFEGTPGAPCEVGLEAMDPCLLADDDPIHFADLPFDYPPTPANPAAPKPKCRRHRWRVATFSEDSGATWREETFCERCNLVKNPILSRRGRLNKNRGLGIQRKVLAQMGLDSIPGNGPTDGRSRGENPLFLAEVKSGGRFSEQDYADMAKLPAKAGQARLLVKVETPGPGRKARATVTMPLEDFLGLHGPVA